MPNSASVKEINADLARRINEEALRDPNSPYAGKFVGIANGEVVVVADDLDTMLLRLRQIEPDSTRTYSIEASHDYSVVEEIWSCADAARATALAASKTLSL